MSRAFCHPIFLTLPIPSSKPTILPLSCRVQMGFNGLVVSDCGALDNIWQPEHHAAANSSVEAAALALRAGTDLACIDYSALHESVAQGLVAEEDVTRAATRVLLTRWGWARWAGLFGCGWGGMGLGA